MRRGDYGALVATIELMLLHVETAGPRATPFPDQAFARLRALHEAQADIPWPERAGRSIAIPRRESSGVA